MKFLKGILGLMLSVCLLCTTLVPAEAAENYTYTVRFFSGKQGLIDGQEVVVFHNLRFGDRVTFDRRTVSLSNGSKYYIKGIRESGKDNNTVNATSFIVTEDQDYVVAYGILGNSVAYTVNYEDMEGNTLAPSETFYGNVGDKPVIAFLYIEGYQPSAYNLTKTLSANAAENVFTFIYREIVLESNGDGSTNEDGTGSEENEIIDLDGNGNADAEGDGSGQNGDGMNGDGTNGDGTDISDEDMDIENLDDEKTPLGYFAEWVKKVVEEIGATILNLPLAAKIILGILLAVLIGIGLWFLFIYKKKDKEEEEDQKVEEKNEQ